MMTHDGPSDLFGNPLEPVTVQGELNLPGEDAIDRRPILLASDLPMDPATIPLPLEDDAALKAEAMDWLNRTINNAGERWLAEQREIDE